MRPGLCGAYQPFGDGVLSDTGDFLGLGKLVDQQIERNSKLVSILERQADDMVFLDPIQLFSEIDWTLFEEDVQVINKIYSQLFDEVVISNKQ